MARPRLTAAGDVARPPRPAERAVFLASLCAAVLTVHSLVNARLLRRPPVDPPVPHDRVAVLLPLRDEALRVGPCLRAALIALEAYGSFARLLVLDDGSSDGTADVVRQVAGGHPRVELLTGAPLPAGWLGKPHACAQLAAAASGADVLVFLDADVVLAPHALTAAVTLLRAAGLDLVSPYPRQLTSDLSGRLVQPLLQWSWLTTLPLRVAEGSPRDSLAAANGQFMLVDAAAYDRCGGHAGVRTEVLEDIALVRAVKRSGGRGGVADGTDLATCRMYEGWPDLRDGYAKSLWSAFGSPAGAVGAMGFLLFCYVLPAAAALRGSRTGVAGYVFGVAGRAVTGRRTGSRVWPDALAHPVSVALLARLTARSVAGHRRGTLSWKGRSL